MIEWGEERLSNKDVDIVRVSGISVGSTRYLKAALVHAAWFREKEINETAKDTWPPAVVEARRQIERWAWPFYLQTSLRRSLAVYI
jgi:hypothetical protein